jgi:DNA-binding beta-propeller fold protein YncE
VLKDLISNVVERFARPADPGEPPGRIQSFARALKYALIVAAPVAALLVYQWLADVFLAAPGEIFLIWAAAVLVVSFVFRARGFHAMILLGAAVLLYYPAHLIFVNSRVIPVLYLAAAGVAVWLLSRRGRAWPAAGYALVFLTALFLLLGETMGPVFSSDRMDNPRGNRGIRKIDGPALDLETGKTVNLDGVNALNIIASPNGKRLYASYERGDGAAGVAAFPLQKDEQAMFRPLGGMGARLIQIHEKTGDVYASSLSHGALYRLQYADLSIVEEHPFTMEPFAAAAVDESGAQVFVADPGDHALKVFSLSGKEDEWASIPSGGFKFKLKPIHGENLLPGTRSLSDMIVDPARRRLFLTYALSRDLVAVDMDEYRVVKIDRSLYPCAASAAMAPSSGLLFLAKPLGFIEAYDTGALRQRFRLPRHGGYRALAYDSLNARLVAANYYSGTVHFLDPTTGGQFDRRHVCPRITKMSVSPASGNVYVTCEGGIFELDPEAAGVRPAQAVR